VGDLSGRNFGLLIAYLIPGFTALWGLGHVSEPVRAWLQGAGSGGPSVGSALYVVLASIGCGMTASLFRWLLVDTLHHRTGVVKPVLDESNLTEKLAAFDYLVENHYRYYQFYGNSAVAMVVAYTAWRVGAGADSGLPAGQVLCLALLTGVFLLGSRDALLKYYARSVSLLGAVSKESSHDERQPPAQESADDGVVEE
jgi:hypothetical protein